MTTRDPIAPTPQPSASSAAAFVGSIPALYDQHLGPLLFEFSAADMAERLGTLCSQRAEVLEVACGTGICTEHLWRALPQGSQLVATDLNPAMLAFASRRRGALSNVTYRVADALELPFDDGTFDAVVCQFGIMFFPDKERGLREMARVLKPGGTLLLNVWGSLQANPVIQLAHETIGSFFPDDPPRFLEVPFGDHDTTAHTARLLSAGLQDVSSTVVSARVERPAVSVARGLVEGNPGVLEIQRRGGVTPETVVQVLSRAIARRFGSPTPTFDLEEIVFTAHKPAAGKGARS